MLYTNGIPLLIPEFMKKFLYQCREFIFQLLRVDAIRFFVAWIRYIFLRWTIREAKSSYAIQNTIYHNALHLGGFNKLAVNRSSLLLYPLSAIRISKKSSILCIGPRSEGEILNYMGYGFHNIIGLDLFSYSPWIDVGDMHALPYTKEFDVTVSSFCLAYSTNHKQCAEEMIRVTKNGGLICIGDEYNSCPPQKIKNKIGYELGNDKKLKSVQETLELFKGNVGHVFFNHERPSNPPEKYDFMVIFSLKK